MTKIWQKSTGSDTIGNQKDEAIGHKMYKIVTTPLFHSMSLTKISNEGYLYSILYSQFMQMASKTIGILSRGCQKWEDKDLKKFVIPF